MKDNEVAAFFNTKSPAYNDVTFKNQDSLIKIKYKDSCKKRE